MYKLIASIRVANERKDEGHGSELFNDPAEKDGV